jgi:hypothetical protein
MEIIKIQSFVKSIGKCKKNPYIINQNHIFFKKLLWSHFWIDFYKFYTKTFGIVYILIGYLLIMLGRLVLSYGPTCPRLRADLSRSELSGTPIKALFIYFDLCPSVMLDSLSCSFTSISFLTNWYVRSTPHTNTIWVFKLSLL